MLTSEILNKKGFTHYEISNFSKPGNECIQNLIYWNCDTYIGFGAGAHSHLKGCGQFGDWGKRWGNIKNPGRYMNSVEQMGNVAEFVENLEKENSINDWIMMGLRLSDGIDISSFSEIYNAELNSDKINYLFEDGLLKIKDGKLKITKDGRIFSNLLIEKVTECVSLLN
jgi:oxygen-independent coproporphyrinogen-3 oxidase